MGIGRDMNMKHESSNKTIKSLSGNEIVDLLNFHQFALLD